MKIDFLYRVTRSIMNVGRRFQSRLVRRVTEHKSFAVWEMPYGDPEFTKNLVAALREFFPTDVMTDTLLFTNNGRNGIYQCYFVAGFPHHIMPEIQPALNAIIGVTRNFEVDPQFLIVMAVNGMFDMQINVTPAKVDLAYKPLPGEPLHETSQQPH